MLIGTVWGVYLFNRLWQQSLREQAAEAIEAAGARGLRLEAPRYAPRLVAAGTIDGKQVRLEWRGGAMGGRSRIRVDGEGRWGALLTTEPALRAALDAALTG